MANAASWMLWLAPTTCCGTLWLLWWWWCWWRAASCSGSNTWLLSPFSSFVARSKRFKSSNSSSWSSSLSLLKLLVFLLVLLFTYSWYPFVFWQWLELLLLWLLLLLFILWVGKALSGLISLLSWPFCGIGWNSPVHGREWRKSWWETSTKSEIGHNFKIEQLFN